MLAQAAGNPLGLINLSEVIADDPAAGRRWAAQPLPLTDRLIAMRVAKFAALPGPARTAVLLAAVADNPDLKAGVPGLSADALAPAEQARVIRVTSQGVQFPHPLCRAAIYHSVPFAERAAAHRRIADALRDQPDRYAWHLAAAALEPDEHVASLLEETAVQAQRRGGAAAAAHALERAAELSPREEDQARRLLAAAALALPDGQADRVEELASQVLSVSADPDLRVAARHLIGWALAWSNRQADALATLISVADEASPRLPDIAWHSIGMAATVVYQSGLPAGRKALLSALDRLDGAAQTPADGRLGYADEQRVWVRACTDPFGDEGTAAYLQHIANETVTDPARVGAAAWLLNETELAVRLLREGLSRLRATGVPSRSGAALSALQWACIDSGRWDETLAAAREAAMAAAAYKMEFVAASADLSTATVLAMRGDHDRVAPLLARALSAVDVAEYHSVAARARQAAGIAALAEGAHLTAYAQLSQLFDDDGAPLHNQISYLCVADLAAAAVRADRHLETRSVIERALAQVARAPRARLEQLAARACGLLAEPSAAEAYFSKALSDPAGGAWPFERAQLQLDYGEWLRRQRRINDARPVLAAALETFRQLGAAPWTRRAEAELRASGIATQAAPTAPDALAELTAQQREIIVLASRGLTNSEIDDRLFLSPRTVESHLYRSYPKLGIAGRHQLRDLID